MELLGLGAERAVPGDAGHGQPGPDDMQGRERRGEPAAAAAAAAGQRHVGAHHARRPGRPAPQQTAGATGEVASVSVGVPSGAAPIPITTIPVPGIGDVDITQALASLLPPPANPLLGVQLSVAWRPRCARTCATASCFPPSRFRERWR
jgi:hypothetical protein